MNASRQPPSGALSLSVSNTARKRSYILTQSLEFSVIVPVFNEVGAVAGLATEIAATLEGRAYEMIFVDDASTDDTRAALIDLKAKLPTLRVLSHRQTAGQSRAIRTGVEAARGRVIGTLDGDGQNDPGDLPDLYRRLTRADAPATLGLVIGERTHRQDGYQKRLSSRLANRIRRAVLKDDNQDSGCGIKVMARDVFLGLPYFDHMHRYMPALVQAAGYSVETQAVRHRPRTSGRSKYDTLGRALAGISDLRGVAWLAKRRRASGGADEL